jgi:signal transduction histidine kinase
MNNGTKESAENATKSKQQFYLTWGHEIRTPLNSIVGFTNVLLKTEWIRQWTRRICTSDKSKVFKPAHKRYTWFGKVDR